MEYSGYINVFCPDAFERVKRRCSIVESYIKKRKVLQQNVKISELKAGQGSVEVTGELIELGETRTFNKFGTEGRVATSRIKDDSGEVMLSLWNDQIDKVKQGDMVTIKNGYVKEWQGEFQLTTGRQGTIEVTGTAGKPEAAEKPEKMKISEEPLEE